MHYELDKILTHYVFKELNHLLQNYLENKIISLKLPDEMRTEFKEPLGLLLTQNPTQELIKLVYDEKPPILILVGDFCVSDALKHGLIPDISIIDQQNLRKPYQKISIDNAKVIKSKNPAATITIETWEKINKIIKSKKEVTKSPKSKEPIILLIDGEEDLLVLPVALEAPENSFVVYGQPHQGIVIIKVTVKIKNKFIKLIERMKVESNENQNSREKNKQIT